MVFFSFFGHTKNLALQAKTPHYQKRLGKRRSAVDAVRVLMTEMQHAWEGKFCMDVAAAFPRMSHAQDEDHAIGRKPSRVDVQLHDG